MLVLHFFDADPREVVADYFTALERSVRENAGGHLLLAAGFDANVPGRDPEL